MKQSISGAHLQTRREREWERVIYNISCSYSDADAVWIWNHTAWQAISSRRGPQWNAFTALCLCRANRDINSAGKKVRCKIASILRTSWQDSACRHPPLPCCCCCCCCRTKQPTPLIPFYFSTHWNRNRNALLATTNDFIIPICAAFIKTDRIRNYFLVHWTSSVIIKPDVLSFLAREYDDTL